MKNAIILHSTNGNSQENWIPWLKTGLEQDGWIVWAPELPDSATPNIRTYNNYLMPNLHWPLTEESILIGHSSGALAALGLLQAQPDKTQVGATYLVGAFINNLGREQLNGLFEIPYDFEILKKRSKKYFVIHSDNDPHCPLPGAQELATQLGTEVILRPGEFHFSIGTGGPKYQEFPFLLDLIKQNEPKA